MIDMAACSVAADNLVSVPRDVETIHYIIDRFVSGEAAIHRGEDVRKNAAIAASALIDRVVGKLSAVSEVLKSAGSFPADDKTDIPGIEKDRIGGN